MGRRGGNAIYSRLTSWVGKFSSDASKVVTRGPGLSQAFVGQKNSFTVDCSKAGRQRAEQGSGGGLPGWASVCERGAKGRG